MTAATPKVATQSLGTTDCASSAKFCGSLTLTQSSDVYVFAAQALDASNAVIANGCATATVNQDTLAVSITMQRFITPAVCGNGIIEPTEQCDPPGGDDAGTDQVCDSQCHSLEEVLSVGATAPAGPAFFCGRHSQPCPESLLVLHRDDGEPRRRAARDERFARDRQVPIAAATSLLAPDGTAFPPVSAPGNQSQPTATLANGIYYYAFADTSETGSPAISLRAFDSTLTDVGSLVPLSGAATGQQGSRRSPRARTASSSRRGRTWSRARSSGSRTTLRPTAARGSARSTRSAPAPATRTSRSPRRPPDGSACGDEHHRD